MNQAARAAQNMLPSRKYVMRAESLWHPNCNLVSTELKPQMIQRLNCLLLHNFFNKCTYTVSSTNKFKYFELENEILCIVL